MEKIKDMGRKHLGKHWRDIWERIKEENIGEKLDKNIGEDGRSSEVKKIKS